MASDNRTADESAAQERELADWCARLSAELGIGDLDVDINAILGLAGRAAHAVRRPAAPLTTFLVGYAVARAGGTGDADINATLDAATTSALRVAAEWRTDHRDDGAADGTSEAAR